MESRGQQEQVQRLNLCRYQGNELGSCHHNGRSQKCDLGDGGGRGGSKSLLASWWALRHERLIKDKSKIWLTSFIREEAQEKGDPLFVSPLVKEKKKRKKNLKYRSVWEAGIHRVSPPVPAVPPGRWEQKSSFHKHCGNPIFYTIITAS